MQEVFIAVNQVKVQEYMKMMPRVLVLMSVYNGCKYLPVQLDSIISQEGVNVSLYIRDDGSEEDPETIIHEYAKKISITYCKGHNIGAAGSFMQLIDLAEEEYDYYAFADQDDFWEKDKLYTAIQYLEDKGERSALYYSDVRRVGQNLERIENPYKKVYHTEIFPDVIILTEAPGCTMVFNKKLLVSLKRYTPNYIYMHDSWVIQVCAAIGGTIVYDERPHILYRQHTDNVIAGLEKIKYNLVQLFRYRVHKFFDFTYKPAIIASELQAGYYGFMDQKNRRIVQRISDAPKCLKYRIYMLFTNKISTPYWIYNMKFKLQVLLNKI